MNTSVFSTRPFRSLGVPGSILGILLAALASCSDSDGDGGGGGGGQATADVLVSNLSSADLLAVRGVVDDVRLVRESGGTTGNLISGPVPLQWLGLHHRHAWLARRNVPPGTYTGVRVGFEPGSVDARRMDGSDVPVGATTDEFTAAFDTPLQVGTSGHHRVVANLDLSTSLSGDATSPPMTWTPGGFASSDDGAAAFDLQPLSGTIAGANSANGTLTLGAFADGDGAAALGNLPVQLSGSTLLLQDDGTQFSTQQDFFDALVSGTTHAEVHGTMTNGGIQASHVAIEDNAAGGGNGNLVKMSGVVLGVGPGDQFEMSLADVGQGSSIVLPASGGTLPETVTVGFDPSTSFVLGSEQTTTNGTLAVGQVVSTKFPSFSNPPFTASSVGIQSSNVGFNGTVTAVDGMPGTFVMNLSPDSPAVMSGQVDSASTPVTVNVTGSTFGLDAGTLPTMSSSDFLVGMNVQPQGHITGPSSAPTISAVNTTMFPGNLGSATVTGASGGSFTTSGGQITGSFGGGVSNGPLTGTFAPNTVFHGAADSAASFETLFGGLQSGQTMNVQLKGVGGGTSSSIVAHEVTTTVTP